MFASASNEQVLTKGQEYLKTLFDEDHVHYLRLDDSFMNEKDGKFVVVQSSQCFGGQYLQFLSDPQQESSTVPNVREVLRLGNVLYIIDVDHLKRLGQIYVVVRPTGLDERAGSHPDGFGERSQYLIKAYQTDDVDAKTLKYRP